MYISWDSFIKNQHKKPVNLKTMRSQETSLCRRVMGDLFLPGPQKGGPQGVIVQNSKGRGVQNSCRIAFVCQNKAAFLGMRACSPPCCRSRSGPLGRCQCRSAATQAGLCYLGQTRCKPPAAPATSHKKLNDVQGPQPAAQSFQYPRIQRKKTLQLFLG